MNSERYKSIAKLLLKLGLSALAIYIVFRKIEFKEVLQVIAQANVGWLALAVLSFNLSKIIAAQRLLKVFYCTGVQIDALQHLRLYYVGMFYNLFLPGGIGGDGYKVYYLRRKSAVSAKLLLSAVFLERLSGAALLFFLACLLALPSRSLFLELPPFSFWLVVAAAVLAIPAFYLVLKLLFKRFLPAKAALLGGSLIVQILQVTTALCILLSFGVREELYLYLAIFQVSSLAAILPISIGGVGLRELLFVYAAQSLPIAGDQSVALALMFFCTIVISSLPGAFINLPKELPEPVAQS